MKKFLLSLIVLLASVLTPLATSAASAEQVLDKTAQNLLASGSMTVRFKFTGSAGSGAGTITMSGNYFYFDTPQLCIWYNGTHQWVLQKSEDEVSLTKPSASEILESNPFALISKHKQFFAAKMQPSGAGKFKILLSPRRKGSYISSATVTVDAGTYLPTRIEFSTSDRNASSVIITSTAKGKALPASYFTYNPKKYPQYELIDLR